MTRHPNLLLLDDPTAGIDVGAKAEIHTIIRHLAADGVGILMSSSEFEELIGLCDRNLVLRDGRIVDEVDAGHASRQSLLLSATGGLR